MAVQYSSFASSEIVEPMVKPIDAEPADPAPVP